MELKLALVIQVKNPLHLLLSQPPVNPSNHSYTMPVHRHAHTHIPLLLHALRGLLKDLLPSNYKHQHPILILPHHHQHTCTPPLTAFHTLSALSPLSLHACRGLSMHLPPPHPPNRQHPSQRVFAPTLPLAYTRAPPPPQNHSHTRPTHTHEPPDHLERFESAVAACLEGPVHPLCPRSPPPPPAALGSHPRTKKEIKSTQAHLVS